MERDKQLDFYRGLSMIYVVCFIHVVYWLKIGAEPIKSLMLFEMPLIFFISGASLSFNKTPRRFKQVFFNRMVRVVIPYYVYAIVSVVVLAIVTMLWQLDISSIKESMFAANYHIDITLYSLRNICSILALHNIPQFPFVNHLWFIWPYLILSCTFELQKRILTKVNEGGYLIVCIFLFLASQWVTENLWIRCVFCYNIFMVMGYCYYRQISIKARLLLLGISLLLIIILQISGNNLVPMQDHKFPPDAVFLFYNLFILALFSLIFSKVRIPEFKWIRWWNERGYTIYLYQNFAFSIIFPFVNTTGNDYTSWKYFSLCAISVFVLMSLLSSIVYPLERKVVKWLLNIK